MPEPAHTPVGVVGFEPTAFPARRPGRADRQNHFCIRMKKRARRNAGTRSYSCRGSRI
jgi:hypothetical protein